MLQADYPYAAATAATGTVLAAGGLWYFQRKLIYPSNFPDGSRTNVPLPTAVGLPFEDVTITCADGVKVKAYVIPARRRFMGTAELRSLSKEDFKRRAQEEVELWTREMGTEDAVEVCLIRA